MPIRCLIVDGNERFGEAAWALLEREGITIVGIATSGEEGIRVEWRKSSSAVPLQHGRPHS